MLERVRSRDLFGGGAPPINGRAFYAKEKKGREMAEEKEEKRQTKGKNRKTLTALYPACMYASTSPPNRSLFPSRAGQNQTTTEPRSKRSRDS